MLDVQTRAAMLSLFPSATRAAELHELEAAARGSLDPFVRSVCAELVVRRRAAGALPTAGQLFAPTEERPAPMPSLRFTIATPPAAKNSRMIFRTGPTCPVCKKRSGPITSKRSEDADRAFDSIQTAVVQALKAQAPQCFGERRALLLEEDACVQLVHNVRNETCDVIVEGRGMPPKKGATGRRRDVVNLPEIVLDALQGIAFANDNQVADLRVWRNVDAPTNGGIESW